MKFFAISLPIFYLLHCTEEFYFPGGFRHWYHQYRPNLKNQTSVYYLKVNIIAFVIVLLNSIYYFTSHGNNNSGLLIASSFLAWNSLVTHVVGTFRSKTYSPGVITGVCFYMTSFIGITTITVHESLLPLGLTILYALLGMIYELWNLYKSKRGQL